MKMIDIPLHPELQRARIAIQYYMDQIRKLFKNPLITIVIRNPDQLGADVVITMESDVTAAIAVIQNTKAQGRH